MKAKYCICKNTYSLDCGDELNCNEDRRELWAQGIGDISAKQPRVFNNTFDNTFN